MRRILISLPEDIIDQIDREAAELFVSRNTLLTWKILDKDHELAQALRSRSDKPQKKLSSPKPG